MNNLKNKIIKTFLWAIFGVIIIKLFFCFIKAMILYDDDVMFISALLLASITCITVMIEIISAKIAQIWPKKKKDNKEQRKWKI